MNKNKSIRLSGDDISTVIAANEKEEKITQVA